MTDLASLTLSKYWSGKSRMIQRQTGLFSYWLCLDYLLKCRLIRMSMRMSKAALYPQYYTTHMFQPSRFERETPVCLPSYRLISKSPVLTETCPNFQFFVKIPICIASYFVFWCFICVTVIGNAKNTLQIHVNSLFLQ